MPLNGKNPKRDKELQKTGNGLIDLIMNSFLLVFSSHGLTGIILFAFLFWVLELVLIE